MWIFRLFAAFVACATVITACGDETKATGVIVQIHSDLEVELASVRVELSDQQGTKHSEPELFFVPKNRTSSFLLSFAVAPAPGRADGPFLLTATGIDTKGVDRVQRRELVSFASKTFKTINVWLHQACVDKECRDPETTCSDRTVLADGTGPCVPVSADSHSGGTTSDAGPGDGDVPDARAVDSAAEDAAQDGRISAVMDSSVGETDSEELQGRGDANQAPGADGAMEVTTDSDGGKGTGPMLPDSMSGCGAGCRAPTLVCAANGVCVQCASASDCSAPRDECSVATCDTTSGTCGLAAKAEHATCSGGVCDQSGSCVGCIDNQDCTVGSARYCSNGSCVECVPSLHPCADSTTSCVDNTCVPKCGNGIIDNDEDCEVGISGWTAQTCNARCRQSVYSEAQIRCELSATEMEQGRLFASGNCPGLPGFTVACYYFFGQVCKLGCNSTSDCPKGWAVCDPGAAELEAQGAPTPGICKVNGDDPLFPAGNI